MINLPGMDHPPETSVLSDLAASAVRFHGWAPDVEVNWALGREALKLIVDLVQRGDRTLETGTGYSTVVFGALGAQHTAISPFAFEHDRVRSWCESHDIDLSAVMFIAAASQDVLPTLDPSPLDLVLIDGDHAFPTPFIDFYYAGGRLVPGGRLVVDDTHLRTGRVLEDFLFADTARWRLHSKLPTTTVFERVEGDLIPRGGWEAQPWGAKPLPIPGGRLSRHRKRIGRIRNRLQTRLRVLPDRLRRP